MKEFLTSESYMFSCRKCKSLKERDEFVKDKNRKDGIAKICRKCNNQRQKEYQNKNKEKVRKWSKKWREQNKEYIREKERHDLGRDTANENFVLRRGNEKPLKEIREKRKKYLKRYEKENKEKIKETKRLYYLKIKEEKWKKFKQRMENDLTFKEKHLKNIVERNKKRRKNDINYKLKTILRGRIYHAINDNNKFDKTIEILGCSIQDFKLYLESKFLPGMSWNNYGLWRKGQPMTWHIDHIIPCSAFDLSKEEEQKKCFHWSNMRPLWALENIMKGDKIA